MVDTFFKPIKNFKLSDIQATAIRLADAKVLGQAASSEMTGRDPRAARSFGVRDIAEATALALMEDMCADMADLAAILTRNDIIAESNIPIEIRFCNSNIVSTLQGIQKKTTDMGDDPAQFLNKEWSNFLKSAEKAVEATHSICQNLRITCRVSELYEENQKATNEDEQNFIDANPNKPDIHKLIVIHEYTQSTETLRAIRQNVSELGVNQQGEAGALSEMHSYLLSIYSDQIIRDKKQKCK